MQQSVGLNLMCPDHGKKIISVQLSETGDSQMLCKKCLTKDQISIEQLAEQLTDLRSKKIQNLIEQGRRSEKRLGSLKKLIITIKGKFNEQMDNIIDTLTNEIYLIKQESEQIQQPLEQLNISQVSVHIKELKKQEELKVDLFNDKDERLRNQIILQYLELIKQLNKLIKQGADWKMINEDIINLQNTQKQVTQYQQFTREEGINCCYAMSMDRDEKILINGQSKKIQIWNFNSDGKIILTQILNGHTSFIRTLCFSQKDLWFLSGSDDTTIRIWKRDTNNWISQQIIKDAHKGQVLGIVLNNEEDQFISCSTDCTIKVWMKGMQWECVQTLSEYTNSVLHLSFSHDFKLLASNECQALVIWQIEKDKKWKLKQVIDHPSNDKHTKIKFLDNNEIITGTKNQGNLLRYIQDSQGLFQLKSEIKLNQIKEQNSSYFPIIYNEFQGLVILRHNDQTFILKKQVNGEFLIHQVLNGNYRAGYVLSNGKHLIIHDHNNKCLEILKY